MAPILVVVGTLLLLVVIVVVVFVIGMRRKTPWVLNAVRRFARGVGNPFQMRSAGRPGSYASVIRHTGRVSGKAYETPVAARITEDGFVIATVYGPNTDWLKNVLASGSATIAHEGRIFQVAHPEVVPTDTVERYFGDKELRNLRRYRVTRCVRSAPPMPRERPPPPWPHRRHPARNGGGRSRPGNGSGRSLHRGSSRSVASMSIEARWCG